MDSFATRDATLAALERHPALSCDVPADFLQSREPKLRADDHRPVQWPADPALEWCPPGHGALYVALAASGMLDALRERGYRWVFASNADNLGAVPDPRILAWVARKEIPFLMEVVEGTQADRKGGHIARRDGRLVLRETAQAPPDDPFSFGDVERWRFYNTNNLWIDLDVLAARGEPLDLPLIVNRKTVDPRDPSTPAVLQLETAMGGALGAIEGAQVLCVPRSRFAPVKTTDDLLVARSDVYELRDDGRLDPVAPAPFVALDPEHYRRLDDFEARFPGGPPSLRRARRLVVHGDVTFRAGVSIVGDVELHGPATVPGGAVLEG
jgi:UTP--glucose-1-phosphate uridylyltransferase